MRRFLNLKALGLALVGLLLMAVMAWLGLWQLGVYEAAQRSDAEATLHLPPVPLSQLLGRDAAFPEAGVSRPVVVSGRFLEAQQVYVRSLRGATHEYAVVTPLVTSDGSAILVVRGSTDSLGAAAPAGPVTVRGILEPSGSSGGPPDARRVTNGLSISSLVGAIGPDLYSGYILQQTSTPPQSPALPPVPPALPHPSRWSGIRNLLYACQWWAFAGFVAFMWWRMTGDLLAQDRAQENLNDADTDALTSLR